MTEETRESIQISTLLEELSDSLISLDESADIHYVNRLIERCTLNVSTLTSILNTPVTLLMTIKNFLLDDAEYADFDYEELLNLLDNLISICSFQRVLEIYTINDLEQALSSNINNLARIACKIVRISQPTDYFINAELKNGIFPIILNLYFNSNTNISIINEIEKIFQKLSCDEKVRNFILNDNLSLLMKVKTDFDTLTISRLLELLTIEVNLIDVKVEYNELVFLFAEAEIFKAIETDSFLFINLLRYFISILELIDISSKEITIGAEQQNSDRNEILLNSISPLFPTIGKIYQDNVSDVVLFAKSYFFKFFEKVSYLNSLDYFRSLDVNFINIDYDNAYLVDYLSFVNPEYLFEYENELILNYVRASASHITILRNLISNEKTFSLVRNKITASNILDLPYMEQMILLEKITRFEYSTVYLVSSLPKVMSNLIDDGNSNVIVEPETVEMRSVVIRNLLEFEREVLNVWYIPLTEELVKINHPGYSSQPSTKIADTFA